MEAQDAAKRDRLSPFERAFGAPRLQLSTLRSEILAGVTTSFAMVPEVVGFAFVAGVNPMTGLYAAFTAGLVAAAWGGRPGMVTGGAGSLAVVSTGLVAGHGVEYLFAAVLLMGLIQVLTGVLKLGSLIDFVPHSVMLGFVNGLAIVIFLAQLRQIPWHSDALAATAAVICLTVLVTALLPKITKVVPSALAAVGLATLSADVLRLPVKHIHDLVPVRGSIPTFHIPSVPLTPATFQIVLPYAVVLAGVGLTESLLTQSLVNEITETSSSHNRECVGQGLANVVTGLFAGMGGCAMIGQTMVNIESGGRHRLSGIVEALMIAAFILVASGLIGAVPVSALVGVMLVVVFRTFAWASVRQLTKAPRSDALVMILVTAITVYKDLATAVAVGVVLSSLLFVRKLAGDLCVSRLPSASGPAKYQAKGLLFFGSVQGFLKSFQPGSDSPKTVLDLAECRLIGQSATEAVNVVARKYAKAGKSLVLTGVNLESEALLRRMGCLATIE